MMFLVLLINFQQEVIIVCFKLNQEVIEQKYCINKSKPQLQCHGKCHLKKELQEKENSGSGWVHLSKNMDIIPLSILEFEMEEVSSLNRRIVFFYKDNRYPAPYIEILLPPPIS